MESISPRGLPSGAPASDVLQRFVHEARTRYPEQVGEVIVFGSQARGDARPDSDIDLWVEWHGREGEALICLVPIATHLFVETGILVAVHPVSPEHRSRLQRLGTRFYQNVHAEGLRVEG